MPKVGKKMHKTVKEAKKAAKRTGKKMIRTKKRY
jgi:Sec-independent protein translocase protein TatA